MKKSIFAAVATTALAISAFIAPVMADEHKPNPARMLKHLDADGDGRISDAEFQPPRHGPGAERWRETDADGDGVITQAELDAHIEALTEGMGAKARQQFTDSDLDGDGQVTSEEQRRAHFARMDGDGDGYLTPEEMEAAHAARKAEKKGGKGHPKH